LKTVGSEGGAQLAELRPLLQRAQWVIDGLRDVASDYQPSMRQAIEVANSVGHPRNYPLHRIAIDFPSGMDPDSGAVEDPTFRGDYTMTFFQSKLGFGRYLDSLPPRAPASGVLGEVQTTDMGVPWWLIVGEYLGPPIPPGV